MAADGAGYATLDTQQALGREDSNQRVCYPSSHRWLYSSIANVVTQTFSHHESPTIHFIHKLMRCIERHVDRTQQEGR